MDITRASEKEEKTIDDAGDKKKKRNKFIIDAIIYVLIIGTIAFGIPKLLVKYLDTTEPMAAITSGSMWPVLKEGDLVFIEGLTKEEIEVGDILVFENRTNGTLTIHRVTKLEEEKITTKGDANFAEDAPVNYSDVVGRAFEIYGKPARIPFLGSITMLVNASRTE